MIGNIYIFFYLVKYWLEWKRIENYYNLNDKDGFLLEYFRLLLIMEEEMVERKCILCEFCENVIIGFYNFNFF